MKTIYQYLSVVIGFAAEIIIISLVQLSANICFSADQPQWGQAGSRNQVSNEVDLPADFELPAFDHSVGKFKNLTPGVLFAEQTGDQAHGVPVVADGKVYIGTNNSVQTDDRFPDNIDYGVFQCRDAQTGNPLWSLFSPKFLTLKYADWWYIGQCATPVVEKDRLYLVSSNGNVLCLDVNGMANGNDGPFMDELERLFPDETEGKSLKPTDADILWRVNLYEEFDVHQHNCANCSVLILGDYLYVGTGNGCEFSHSKTSNPAAPTLVVLDKKTGKAVARDDFKTGAELFHGQWSSPTVYTDREGRPRIVYGAGNGKLYGFAPFEPGSPWLAPPRSDDDLSEPENDSAAMAAAADNLSNRHGSENKPNANGSGLPRLRPIWTFNGQPEAQVKDDVPIELGHYSPSYFVVGCPVFAQGRIYVAVTQNIFHGPNDGWFLCIDPNAALDESGTEPIPNSDSNSDFSKPKDITRSGLIWSFKPIRACVSTPAVREGLVYTISHDGTLYCLDALTGEEYSQKRLGSPAWGAPLIADGRIYVGTGRRLLYILKEGRNLETIAQIRLPYKMMCSPSAANKTLYILTYGAFYGVKKPF